MPSRPFRLLAVVTAATAAPLASTAALCWATPKDLPHRPAEALHYLTGHPLDTDLSALLAVVAWATICWLALAALATLAGRVPGILGALARPVAARVAPAAVRRMVELAVGAGVATSIALAQMPLASAAGSTPSSISVSLDRPAAAAAASTAPAIDLDRPTVPPPAAHTAGTVTVRVGDTLWAIAARHLGPQATAAEVAAAWPLWHAANRSVIGPDPSLLHPGQRLVVPTG